MIPDYYFDIFMMKALPYMFLAAAAIAEGLAVYLRWPKKKIF